MSSSITSSYDKQDYTLHLRPDEVAIEKSEFCKTLSPGRAKILYFNGKSIDELYKFNALRYVQDQFETRHIKMDPFDDMGENGEEVDPENQNNDTHLVVTKRFYSDLVKTLGEKRAHLAKEILNRFSTIAFSELECTIQTETANKLNALVIGEDPDHRCELIVRDNEDVQMIVGAIGSYNEIVGLNGKEELKPKIQYSGTALYTFNLDGSLKKELHYQID